MGATISYTDKQVEMLLEHKRQKQEADRKEREAKQQHDIERLVDLKKGLRNVSEAYFVSESKCNIPPFVMWLSPNARDQCRQARMVTVDAMLEFGSQIAEM